MKTAIFGLTLQLALFPALAQEPQSTNDWVSAATNQEGREYPKVNSEGRVRARISAPQAQSVQLEISGERGQTITWGVLGLTSEGMFGSLATCHASQELSIPAPSIT